MQLTALKPPTLARSFRRRRIFLWRLRPFAFYGVTRAKISAPAKPVHHSIERRNRNVEARHHLTPPFDEEKTS
jgi:hypothetical protein